ncbi:hypothetical protein GGU10DRAFT_379828 [Lentinula aff. detonsa]|uniref:Uncharacterized protein n=1 Tax=Lentinula aff. detonsa TaxID=2804958 RepID=A0AA38KWX8_9AGAR|nr:hypothetical protein GGU10DRAFT_379828 [Lentinula aff. detonsa]
MIPPRVRHQYEYRLFVFQGSVQRFIAEYEAPSNERVVNAMALQLAWAWSECQSLEERAADIRVEFESLLPERFWATVADMEPEDLIVLPPRVLAKAGEESWAVVSRFARHRQPPLVMFEEQNEVVVYVGRQRYEDFVVFYGFNVDVGSNLQIRRFYSFRTLQLAIIFVDNHWYRSPEWEMCNLAKLGKMSQVREDIESVFSKEDNFAKGIMHVWEWISVG